jgi:hypothetical protein
LICLSLLATASSCARDCANHTFTRGSSSAMRRASQNVALLASLPFGRKAERMNLASSIVMMR